jgi:hypothetical protein
MQELAGVGSRRSGLVRAGTVLTSPTDMSVFTSEGTNRLSPEHCAAL